MTLNASGRPERRKTTRALALLRSLIDPRVWLHPLRLMHHAAYSHVLPRAEIRMGQGVRIAPNASFRNGARIDLGDRVQIGEYVSLWAGRPSSGAGGRIEIGAGATLGPHVFISAADYGLSADAPVTEQGMVLKDVVIGPEVWIGARAVITAGVTIGAGAVIGAGSVVTRDIPAGAIAAGVPARVIRLRG